MPDTPPPETPPHPSTPLAGAPALAGTHKPIGVSSLCMRMDKGEIQYAPFDADEATDLSAEYMANRDDEQPFFPTVTYPTCPSALFRDDLLGNNALASAWSSIAETDGRAAIAFLLGTPFNAEYLDKQADTIGQAIAASLRCKLPTVHAPQKIAVDEDGWTPGAPPPRGFLVTGLSPEHYRQLLDTPFRIVDMESRVPFGAIPFDTPPPAYLGSLRDVNHVRLDDLETRREVTRSIIAYIAERSCHAKALFTANRSQAWGGKTSKLPLEAWNDRFVQFFALKVARDEGGTNRQRTTRIHLYAPAIFPDHKLHELWRKALLGNGEAKVPLGNNLGHGKRCTTLWKCFYCTQRDHDTSTCPILQHPGWDDASFIANEELHQRKKAEKQANRAGNSGGNHYDGGGRPKRNGYSGGHSGSRSNGTYRGGSSNRGQGRKLMLPYN
ncbi:hypothetical protein BKA62DRAFT_772753 [Auriculariales sp. MPI-PUGE-AT-0066]|nr:hypothetical protein BKA62DRAFT_772753 [Auriculariales sp. MPI-PUGE-AT-0066]